MTAGGSTIDIGVDKRFEVQLEKLRQEMGLRIQNRGLEPSFVLELSQDGLAELKRRLDKLELKKVRKPHYLLNSSRWFISQLVRNPAQQRRRELFELSQGLAKDPVRVKKAKLQEECNELIISLGGVERRIQVVMCYEDSEDRVAMLEETKARMERALRQKQEEMAQLCQEGAGPA